MISSTENSEKKSQPSPLTRIDVPNRVLRWEAMTLADLLEYEMDLERAIPLLTTRWHDRRLLPVIRRRAKNKLKRAKKERARAQVEIERRKGEMRLDE